MLGQDAEVGIPAARDAHHRRAITEAAVRQYEQDVFALRGEPEGDLRLLA